MAKQSIYEYKDYKKFILDRMSRLPQAGRGQRKHLAEFIGCQTPFITHVLSGDYHFSLEQAEATARWLGLEDSETEFFLLLVLKQRAGTRSLEQLLNNQISRRCESASILRDRIKISDTLPENFQSKYYSSWQYAAIHMALTLPHLRTIEALERTFQLSPRRIQSVLQFLVECGLVQETKSGWKVVKPVIHLDRQSPHLVQHHVNWRLRSVDSIQNTSPNTLHFSSVFSVSNDDYEWIRERLSLAIEEIVQKIRTSTKEEKVATFCTDFFDFS